MWKSRFIGGFRCFIEREFNEYNLVILIIVKTSARRFHRLLLITEINLKSQLRSAGKKSSLGSINGWEQLTIWGKSRQTSTINFLRLPGAHVLPKIYQDTIDFLSSADTSSINSAKIFLVTLRYCFESTSILAPGNFSKVR